MASPCRSASAAATTSWPCRDQALRANWVHHSPAVPCRSSACNSSEAGDEVTAAEEQQHPEQQCLSQQDDSSQGPAAEPPLQQDDELQQQQEPWQQQGQVQVQPAAVEFGSYFSQHPVRQYVGHTEDILDISWSAGTSKLLRCVLVCHGVLPVLCMVCVHTPHSITGCKTITMALQVNAASASFKFHTLLQRHPCSRVFVPLRCLRIAFAALRSVTHSSCCSHARIWCALQAASC